MSLRVVAKDGCNVEELSAKCSLTSEPETERAMITPKGA